MNLELRKISDWAHDNKLKFNEHKSKAMLITRRKRKEIKRDRKILIQQNSRTS
jgi:hypothetical protein